MVRFFEVEREGVWARKSYRLHRCGNGALARWFAQKQDTSPERFLTSGQTRGLGVVPPLGVVARNACKGHRKWLRNMVWKARSPHQHRRSNPRVVHNAIPAFYNDGRRALC